METDEFIDTYSDDLEFLFNGRAALLTHPLSGWYAFHRSLDASACRILAVLIIGNIETMLETWRDKYQIGVLDRYFCLLTSLPTIAYFGALLYADP